MTPYEFIQKWKVHALTNLLALNLEAGGEVMMCNPLSSVSSPAGEGARRADEG